ncbi:MAG: hypothetical protein NT094_03530 [Candidatus Staskawiczbacteria bacterium]|nr:hypothetical protein [Candidatus Staskawiczbacteria bacterium]
MSTKRRKARRICPHVHCRGEGWSYKSTIAETLMIAESQGICAIFDMPNNSPLTIDRWGVERRLALVPTGSPVEYYTYVGLTSDTNQIKEAVWCWHNFKEVVALKMFAGHSIGPMAVVAEKDQLHVWRVLASEGYIGIVAVHCEKEKLLVPK